MLTWVEINKAALEHNLRVLKAQNGEGVLLMPVLKANAYGHGIGEVARICNASLHVDRICVVNLEEALLLRRLGITKPIVVLDIYEDDVAMIEEGVRSEIIFPVYDRAQLQILNDVGSKLGAKVTIHIKFDTGTSRVGFMPSDVDWVANELHKFSYLQVEAIWSHYSSSESDEAVTDLQFKTLLRIKEQLTVQGREVPFIHMDCSASTVLYPRPERQAVRVGLSTYGLYPADTVRPKIELKPVLSWKTKVIQVKTVPSGTGISYGRTFVTSRETRLAILPIGYADGYVRSYSNQSCVIIKGHRARVLGRVCMNLTMVDVTDIPGTVERGDEVVLIGTDGSCEVTADELAALSSTINYEVVTRINPQLPRVIV